MEMCKVLKYIFLCWIYRVQITAFEIGARGYVNSKNRGQYRTLILVVTISSMAISGSYYIYLARNKISMNTCKFSSRKT
jgi:hypothetical protein